MAKVNYNYDTFAEDVTTLGQASSKLSLLEEKFDLNKYPNLDSRIKSLLESRYGISKIGTAAKDTAATINTYNNWLLEANQNAKSTENSVRNHAREISPEAISSTFSGGNTSQSDGTSLSDGNKINSQTLSALPSEIQETIRERLKSAGYTDAEINKILNGEQEVSKKTFDMISSEISKMTSNNSDAKTKIKKVLGDNLFDADGALNKSVLAATMLTGTKTLTENNINFGSKTGIKNTDNDKLNLTESEEENTSVGSILSKFGKGISKIIPEAVNATKDVKTGNASLIASGVSLVGSAGGAVAITHKNNKMLEFTKKDFDGLDKFTKNAFVECLKSLRCTTKEIETIMTSTYRIHEQEIMTHIRNIKKAEKASAFIGQDIYSIYKFTFYGVENEINNFKLFLIMIIDGINISDKYNFYNVLNRTFKNKKDINMIYTGINYLDYIVTPVVK